MQPRDSTKDDILSVKNCASKEILPPLAQKQAKAATLTAVLLQPVKDVFNNIEDKIDMVEIACSPTSILTNVFDENGHRCLRISRMSGYDLDTKAQDEAGDRHPEVWMGQPSMHEIIIPPELDGA